MPDLTRSRHWDPELEGNLPDCRVSYLNREKNQVQRGRVVFDMVYCAYCHQPKMLAPVSGTAYAFFLCNECVEEHGPPAGCVEVKPCV